jgi:hypothetical protein
MLHQKFAPLRERHSCGERLGTWIDSSSDWFPGPLRNVHRVAPRPVQQRTQLRPLPAIELIDEQDYVAPRWTHSKIEVDPIGANQTPRPQPCAMRGRLVRAPLRNQPGCVGGDDDRRGCRLGPKDDGMTRDDGERRELCHPGPGDEEIRRGE